MSKTILSLDVESRQLIIQSWPNVLKMLNARGYDTTKCDKEVTIATQWNEGRPQITVKHFTNDDDVINIVFMTTKLQIQQVNLLFTLFSAMDQKHCVLITKEMPKAKAKSKIEDNKALNIELFDYYYFGFCLIERKDVDGHVVLTKDEKEKVKSMYEKDEKCYPIQLKSSPLSRYYDLKQGTMILYHRKDNVQGIIYQYRIVN